MINQLYLNEDFEGKKELSKFFQKHTERLGSQKEKDTNSFLSSYFSLGSFEYLTH